MYERKIMQELVAWKESLARRRKALVIKGLRQVGKTYIVQRFAERHYPNVVFIDFKQNASMKAIFDGDFSVDRMTLDISAHMPDARFVPQQTLIVFDEVQECANARASVKAFVADGRYDVVCTGSLLERKGRSETYQAAIQWLYDAGIANLCYNLAIPQAPLEGNKIDNAFKLYLQDTGLFVAMLERGTSGDILSGDLGIYKGAVYENIVADALSKMDRPLYYFRKESGLEIDFVARFDGNTWLAEVKATTGNAKSLKTVMAHPEHYGECRAVKLGEYNIGEANGVLTLPYYLAFMLDRL